MTTNEMKTGLAKDQFFFFFLMATILQLKVAKRRLFEKLNFEP